MVELGRKCCCILCMYACLPSRQERMYLVMNGAWWMIYNHGILLRPVPFFWRKQINTLVKEWAIASDVLVGIDVWKWCMWNLRNLWFIFLVFRTMVDWSSSEFCIFIHTIRNSLNYVFLFTQTFVNNNVF